MIQKEVVTIGERQYDRTWSDDGMMIERDGIQYAEAIDPLGYGREYTETDIPIPELDPEMPEELTERKDEGVPEEFPD